ncbi:MAG: lysophospholipid acyltransferase family protein [Candidatus Rokubacteria bacterium]|nr:lysophospholipid acyltransferase family protein [Candidatus Rokubacteria bacterium]MBI3827753.1 lysophospholipid acyltransferase family protein [Candidatus Rokubacteria bacterium]
MSLLARVTPAVVAALVRVLATTLRLRISGAERLAAAWAAGRPLIYVVWHGRILMVPWTNAWLRRTRGARRAAVLVSRSADGEIMARFVARFGLPTIRGSSSRGGMEAIRALAAAIRRGEDVAIVPDGPRGPSERVQPGAVALAALTGAPIVPLAFAARPARRLASWDRFLVPLPFARGAVAFGEPLPVARNADREQARERVEQALHEVTAAADRLVSA